MFRFFILALLLLVPSTVWAAEADNDGDACSEAGLAIDVPERGGLEGIGCVMLCDSYDATGDPVSCTEFDLNAKIAATGKRPGFPDLMVIEVHNATGCSAGWSVDVDTGPLTGGTEHDVAVLNSSTTRAVIWRDSLSDRYLMTQLSTLTDCTDLDVIMLLYKEDR